MINNLIINVDFLNEMEYNGLTSKENGTSKVDTEVTI